MPCIHCIWPLSEIFSLPLDIFFGPEIGFLFLAYDAEKVVDRIFLAVYVQFFKNSLDQSFLVYCIVYDEVFLIACGLPSVL